MYKFLLFLLIPFLCFSQIDFVDGWQLLSSAKDTIRALNAITVQDSIAFPVDTTALKLLNMDEGRVAILKQISNTNTSGSKSYMVIDSSLDESNPNVYDHPTIGLQWVALSELNRSPVNVMDYGAIPDDGLSDSTAFAQALATGRRVEVPDGQFLVAKMYISTYGQQLVGVGKTRSDLIPIDGTDTLIVVGQQSSTISGFEIHGQGARNDIVAAIAYVGYPLTGSDALLDDCLIWYFQSITDTAAAVLISHGNSITINNCAITYNDVAIEILKDVVAGNLEIHDCRLGRNRNYGLLFDGGAASSSDYAINIVNCTFEYWGNYDAFGEFAVPIYLNKPMESFRVVNSFAELDSISTFMQVDQNFTGAIELGTFNGNSVATYVVEFADDITANLSMSGLILPGYRAPGEDIDSSTYAIKGLDNPSVIVNIRDTYIQTKAIGSNGLRDTINVVVEARPAWYDVAKNVGNSATTLMQPTYADVYTAAHGTNFKNLYGIIESHGQYWRKSGIGQPNKMNYIPHFYLDSLFLGAHGSANDTLHFAFFFDDSAKYGSPFNMNLRVTICNADDDSLQWAVYEIKCGAYWHGYNVGTNSMSYFVVDSLIRNVRDATNAVPPDDSDIFKLNAARWTVVEWYIRANSASSAGTYWVWIEGNATNLNRITMSRN